MDIMLESEKKLTVTLKYSELLKLGHTFHSLNYSSPDSRKTIRELLEKAAAQTGFTYKNTSLMIEAYPAEDMGCILVFTRLSAPAAKQFRRVKSRPAVFEFHCADDMLAAAEYINDNIKCRCRLYLFDSRYRLILTGNLSPTDEMHLREYGRFIGKSAATAAHTAEHGELLCSDAINALCKKCKPNQTDFS